MEIEEAVGRAVRARLATELAPVPVHDHAPRDATFPFVAFERHTSQPDDDLGEMMSRHQITLTVRSDARGIKQVRDILGKIRRALHWYDLALDAGDATLVEVERVDATLDGDGLTYMGTALVAVLTDNRET